MDDVSDLALTTASSLLIFHSIVHTIVDHIPESMLDRLGEGLLSSSLF